MESQIIRNSVALFTAISSRWIIDARASTYMIRVSHFFFLFSLSDHENMLIVDSSFSPIVGRGLTRLCKS